MGELRVAGLLSYRSLAAPRRPASEKRRSLEGLMAHMPVSFLCSTVYFRWSFEGSVLLDVLVVQEWLVAQ